jgi:hypothetical protein
MGIKPEALPYAHLTEVYAIRSEEEERHHTWVARWMEFNAKLCATSEPK